MLRANGPCSMASAISFGRQSTKHDGSWPHESHVGIRTWPCCLNKSKTDVLDAGLGLPSGDFRHWAASADETLQKEQVSGLEESQISRLLLAIHQVMLLVKYSCASRCHAGAPLPTSVPQPMPQKSLLKTLPGEMLVMPRTAVKAALASQTPTTYEGRESISPAKTSAAPTESTSRSCFSCAGVSGGGDPTAGTYTDLRSCPLTSMASPRKPNDVEFASQKLAHAVPFQKQAHMVALYL
mmetsp:Transcript_21837/g.66280  ORF Transcript_21837/g.66280 Transcript_21837/m.66280 type:complete len:239 (+) Transcript_21837:2850-3566(+)